MMRLEVVGVVFQEVFKCFCCLDVFVNNVGIMELVKLGMILVEVVF